MHRGCAFLGSLVAAILCFVNPATAAPSPSNLTRLECSTDGPFFDGRIHKLKIGISFINDARTIGVEYLRISPKNSPLLELNNNLSVSRTPKGVEIRGDSDGVYVAFLRLCASSAFRTGTVRLKDLDGRSVGNHVSTVSCRVTE